MRRLFLLGLVLLRTYFAFSQKDLPAYGTIDKADLDMKACVFEEDAPAMMLVDEGSLVFTPDNSNGFFKMVTRIRVRIKVLKSAGLDYATVSIPYFSDNRYERLSDLQGVTYNLGADGSIEKTKLEKNQVFNRTITDGVSETKFSMPAVKVGSVIEYRYQVTRESFSNIDPWRFQGRIPSRISRYSIDIPEYFRITSNLRVSEAVDKKQEEFSDRVNMGNGMETYSIERTTYTMREIPGLHDEPFIGCYKDYIQRLDFQLSAIILPSGRSFNYTTSWEKLAEELRKDSRFGEQLRKHVSIPALKQQLQQATGAYDKMIIIYAYCRKHYTWNGYYDFSSINVKQVAEDRKGSSGDLNLLLINLLRDAGLDVVPALASTRDNGRVNVYYPFMKQFNQVLAIVTINGQEYVLDATEKHNPARLIPHAVMATQVLKVYRDNSEWKELWNAQLIEKNQVSVQAEVTNQGVLQGEAFIISRDYARTPRVRVYNDDKEKFIERYLQPAGTSMKIENLAVKGLDNDSLAFEQKFKFSQPLNSTGDYSYFSINLFNGLDKNPFLADTRVSDIDFGCNRLFSINGHVSIAEGYRFEELPKGRTIIMPDTSIRFTRQFMHEDNTLVFRYTLEFTRPVYFAQEYEYFREFYRQLFELLNEQVVLKKK